MRARTPLAHAGMVALAALAVVAATLAVNVPGASSVAELPGQTTRVSERTSGDDSEIGEPERIEELAVSEATISGDGRFVVWLSLYDCYPTSCTHILIKDRRPPESTTPTVGVIAELAGGDRATPVISRDGCMVTFVTRASFDPRDPGSFSQNARQDVYAQGNVLDAQRCGVPLDSEGRPPPPRLVSVEKAAPPVALVSAAPTTGIAPLTLTFFDSSFGLITSREWDFGDGTSTTTAATTVTHTYSAAGTFRASLTVRGPGGASPAATQDITVTPQSTTTTGIILKLAREPRRRAAAPVAMGRAAAPDPTLVPINADSLDEAISVSETGRFVAYSTSSMGQFDAQGVNGIVVADREANGNFFDFDPATAAVDDNRGGIDDGSDGAHFPSLSDDGRRLVFSSDIDPNRPQGSFGGPSQAYLFEFDPTARSDEGTFVADSFTLLSQRAGAAGSRSTGRTAISGDGKVVAFDSTATNLTDPALPGCEGEACGRHVYAGVIGAPLTLVSVNEAGLPGSGNSFAPALSRDGSIVVFQDGGGDLVAPPSDRRTDPDYSGFDVIAVDRATRSPSRITVTPAGSPVPRDNRGSALSSNGRSVAFVSQASNQLIGADGTRRNVYVRQRTATVIAAPLTLPDALVGQTTDPVALTLTNPTSVAYPIATITVSNGEYAVAPGTCAIAIPAFGTCTLQVTFTPAATGLRPATLTVNAAPLEDAPFGGDPPLLVALSGTGHRDGLAIDPAATTVAAVVGQTTPAVFFTVTNTGTRPNTLVSVALGGANPGDFTVVSDDCSGRTLAADPANNRCTLAVTFTPPQLGDRSATITVAAALGVSVTAAMGGTGRAADSDGLTINPAAATFGDVVQGQTGPATMFTVTNTGNRDNTVAAVSLTGANPGDFALTDGCSTRALAPTATCTVTVAFAPTATGTRRADLLVNATFGAVVTASLTGTGQGVPPTDTPPADTPPGETPPADTPPALTPPADIPPDETPPVETPPRNVGLAADPAIATFPATPVGQTSPGVTITITNTGDGAATLGPITKTGGASGDYTVTTDACSRATLAPGASCTIVVTFSPAVVGTRSASLVISGGVGTRATVVLTGVGLAPPTFVVSPAVVRGVGVITAIGVGFPAATTVVITVEQPGTAPESLTVATDGAGGFRASVVVPRGERPGTKRFAIAAEPGRFEALSAPLLVALPSYQPASAVQVDFRELTLLSRG